MDHSAPSSRNWSPELVKELLYRQFIRSEDVSAMLPPPPVPPQASPAIHDSVRALAKYVQNGGGSLAPAQRGPTTAAGGGGASLPQTPSKSTAPQSAPRTPGVVRKQPTAPGVLQNAGPARTPTTADAAARKAAAPRMPAAPDGVENSPLHFRQQPQLNRRPGDVDQQQQQHPPSISAADPSAAVQPPSPKRSRPETYAPWPPRVPTNARLLSRSRSAVMPLTTARLRAQERVDPDLIFAQPPGDFPLTTIFARYPNALLQIKAIRGLSGDWNNDTFTSSEELFYKEVMGFNPGAPSQCGYNLPMRPLDL